jgi:flavin reductase (DIM6/NTAB) family NADH-FMN oxidoreductase RutF
MDMLNQAYRSIGQLHPPDVPTYRHAFRRTASGVWTVTAACGTRRSGLTATSIVSLSAEPAELLVSVQPNSSTFPLLLASGYFGVNLLASSQQAIADRFAGRNGCHGEARYEVGNWRQTAEGVWLLDDAVVAMACEVGEVLWHRTHALVIGRIVALRMAEEEKPPLVYTDGRYTAPLPP